MKRGHRNSRKTQQKPSEPDLNVDLGSETYQRAVEATPNGMIMVGREGKITMVNTQTEKLFGYSREELLNQKIEKLFPKRFRTKENSTYISGFFLKPKTQPLGAGLDLFGLKKDGTEVPIEIGLNPIETPKGLFTLVSIIDITERKRAEANLRRLATVVTDGNDAITVQDLKGKISAWNRGAERMYGYTESEARAMNIQETIPEAKRQETLEFMKRVQQQEEERKEDLSFETQRLTKDGRTLDVWLTVTKLVDEAGKPVGIATTERDITERKRMEQIREGLVMQLRNANKELEGFAYVVSHDLKAPLRGIDSLAGWIAEDFRDKLDEEGKKNLGMLQTRVKKMHVLIDGILEYSRIGRTREEIETIDLNQLLPGIIEFLSPPVHIQIEVQKKLPVIKAEKTRIHQVFQNLLSNAIKYTGKPQGKIKVGCETEAGFWRFSVSDNGVGIDEKYHERIFGLFQTLDSTETSENTGVGLSLVKKIVELYGGKAGVKSNPGQGSTFWFTFPKPRERE